MQAVCDSRGRFLEVWIRNPGSSSDYISFVRSRLFRKLKTAGFLADGLALFGDNAYVSTETMVTPYRNVRRGFKDDFNFYQSQVRINIECAFGMLVHRWAILRRALPVNMGVKKQIGLTMALCKLHNFCIGEQLSPFLEEELNPADEFDITLDGGVETQVETDDLTPGVLNQPAAPFELINGGEHFEDVVADDLPTNVSQIRLRLLNSVIDQDLHRVVVPFRRRTV